MFKTWKPALIERALPALRLGHCALWVLCLLTAALIGQPSASATEKRFDAARGEAMPIGDGSFEVVDVPRGPVTIYTYRPASASASSPIWVVMAGARRDAARHLAFDYYDTWRPLAERYGAVLLVPEFTAEKWPGVDAYNHGNVVSPGRQLKPWQQTSFYVVEQAFRIAAGSLGSNQRRFSIFGHGAGSQFVQRYVLHSGCKLIDRAVSANPGWYMLPDNEFAYPYGLAGAPIGKPVLRSAFGCNYTLLLGTADINRAGLRNDPGAAAQGKTRYDRGQFYFERARAVAARMGAGFRWHLQEVAGVGHESSPYGSGRRRCPGKSAAPVLRGPATKSATVQSQDADENNGFRRSSAALFVAGALTPDRRQLKTWPLVRRNV